MLAPTGSTSFERTRIVEEVYLPREIVLDRRVDSAKAKAQFAKARNARYQYERKLARIARVIGEITSELAGDDPIKNSPKITEALKRYADVVSEWAKSSAAVMVAEVRRRDDKAWSSVARTMSRELRREIEGAPIGDLIRALQQEQVALITSLPLQAAERVQSIALESGLTGSRASELAQEIMKSGHVAHSRAMLIARTETSRAASMLTQARAMHVGSEGYIWRTAGDYDVRKLHRELEGRFIRWDAPPVTGSNGERSHAGCIYNCRCWAEVAIPEVAA